MVPFTSRTTELCRAPKTTHTTDRASCAGPRASSTNDLLFIRYSQLNPEYFPNDSARISGRRAMKTGQTLPQTLQRVFSNPNQISGSRPILNRNTKPAEKLPETISTERIHYETYFHQPRSFLEKTTNSKGDS